MVFTLCAFITLATIKNMQPQSLAGFKWQYRLLIPRVASEIERIKLREKILNHSNDSSAHKLMLRVYFKDKTYILNTSTQKRTSDSVHKKLKTLRSTMKQSLPLPKKTITAKVIAGVCGNRSIYYRINDEVLEIMGLIRWQKRFFRERK
jgi:hypothetical protein